MSLFQSGLIGICCKVKEMKYDNHSSFIKLGRMDIWELKEVFEMDGVNVRDGYFGLQREIYK